VRRHTGRVATRFVVLLVGDLIAIMIARAFALWLARATVFGAVALPDSPLIVGGRRFIFLGLFTLGAVFAAGGHSRHRALNQPIRLFGAAAGAVLFIWAGGIARGFLPDLVLPMVTTAGVLWLSLLGVRQFSEWFLRDVWPRQRGTGTAILVEYLVRQRVPEEECWQVFNMGVGMVVVVPSDQAAETGLPVIGHVTEARFEVLPGALRVVS